MNSQVSSEMPQRLEIQAERVPVICPHHGEYMAAVFNILGSVTRSNCPKCLERNAAEREARVREEAARKKRELVASLFRRSAIPARFEDRTLANYHAQNDGQRRALKMASRYVETFDDPNSAGGSLVFCGKPGTGKTHLACAIGHALIDGQHAVLFSSVLAAVRHIKETYRKDSTRTESDAIGDLVEPDLLILDEIGVQIGSEHEKMLVFEIINERYQQCRSTVLISNLNQDELTSYLGERVMDRFREAGGVIAFDWTSYRGTKAGA